MKNTMKLQIVKGDITQQKVDVIVNAANSSLLGGGGVDGAIHRVGGAEVVEDCRKIRAKQGGCKTGEAVITKAGKLACKAVIHTVGPVYNNGGADKEKLLSQCYLNSLMLAEEHNHRSIAFPNISTGIYRFPKQKAAKIAIETVKRYRPIKELEQVVFVCFDEENYQLYQEILK